MTIVLPGDYHGKSALESCRVQCITQDEALKEDIRALRIGILNIMPKAETYEFSLLHPLGRSVVQIEPVWIRLKTHKYTSSDHSHLDKLYVHFEEAVAKQRLDGLIMTGAPVEEIEFDEVVYWEEIKRILRYASRNIASTLGICWGGLALAKFMGIDKKVYNKKIFGAYETINLDREHRITGEMDDLFWCAQSRHSGIPDETLELQRDMGVVRLLAYSKEAGYTIFESTDSRFLVHLGHPEYEPRRLVEEYLRDKNKGRKDVEPPKNINLDSPINTWRSHRTEFFSQWIKYLHESTTY
ncbi:homoserine O-succinyltransferase [Chitinispirillales bacterium ANBcel5]|uniref:homoserine O-acetyltransferase/O-succinyltransferase family protein n=1 Tax=Cellulosispirillum alkaliphilum TaxID=3039283 RepID=UPI002A50C8B3|nr:homoserine O-succinyltransferase [Chitinispirillales bacterium ANBcel5]